MPNAAEAIEKLARENERLQLLELARECKDLNEFIEKVKAMTTGGSGPRQGQPPPKVQRQAGSLTPACSYCIKI